MLGSRIRLYSKSYSLTILFTTIPLVSMATRITQTFLKYVKNTK